MTLLELIPDVELNTALLFIVGVVIATEVVKRTKLIGANYIPAVAVIIAVAGALYTGIGWTAGVVAAVVASGSWDSAKMVINAVRGK